MTTRVAIPSKGRLRDACLALLDHAGYPVGMFRGSGSRATVDGLELIEMRPRDAAAWLAAGRLSAAFISTDIAAEQGIEDWPAVELGLSRSDLVLAARDDDDRRSAADLAGATVATHLPDTTARWFGARGIDVTVVPMGGSLEGVCAAGLADAIVDLRETGTSLAQNRLRVVEVMARCQALFVQAPEAPPALSGLVLRLGAALAARRRQYVLLHVPTDKLDELTALFGGLEAPTVIPLAGRDDLVAAHLVVERSELWAQLEALRALGATGIVALPADAVVL